MCTKASVKKQVYPQSSCVSFLIPPPSEFQIYKNMSQLLPFNNFYSEAINNSMC